MPNPEDLLEDLYASKPERDASERLAADVYNYEELMGRTPEIVGPTESTASRRESDKEKDKAKPRPAEIYRDGDSRPVDVITASGDHIKVAYDDKGEVRSLTVIPPHGRHQVFEKTGGWWSVNGAIDYDLEKVTMLSDGSLATAHKREGHLVVHPDGSAEGRDIYDRTSLKVTADGTRKDYDYEDRVTHFGKTYTREKGSQFAKVSEFSDFLDGYQFTHKDGRKETLIKVDREWQFTINGQRETFSRSARLETTPEGERKIIRPDGSSFEGRADGTLVRRNERGQVTESTTPDGITTTYQRAEDGKTTGLEVKDMQGKVIEKATLTQEGWLSDATDAEGQAIKIRKVEVDDKKGSCTLSLDKGQISRLADGTEVQKDAFGRTVDTYADKVAKWVKKGKLDFTESEEKNLKSDLAVINRLDPEKKFAILASFDRIINDRMGRAVDLSVDQRKELVQSLAHQIAHPEAITQGGKHANVMASAERMLASTRPDKYAAMVAALAVDGKYTGDDGTTVQVQRTSDGLLDWKTDHYRLRPITSEVFQNAAANLALHHDGQTYKSYAYGAEELSKPPAANPALDSGERYTDRDGVVHEFTGLGFEQRSRLWAALGLKADSHCDSFASGAELIAAFKAQGEAPLTIPIGLSKEIGYFPKELENCQEADKGQHLITITHIDTSRNPAVVYFEDTIKGVDHSYPSGTGVLMWDIVKAHGDRRRN